MVAKGVFLAMAMSTQIAMGPTQLSTCLDQADADKDVCTASTLSICDKVWSRSLRQCYERYEQTAYTNPAKRRE